MSEAQIRYESDENGRVRALVFAANGEQVMKTEWYDSQSNAGRGLAEVVRTLSTLVEDGEIDPADAT